MSQGWLLLDLFDRDRSLPYLPHHFDKPAEAHVKGLCWLETLELDQTQPPRVDGILIEANKPRLALGYR